MSQSLGTVINLYILTTCPSWVQALYGPWPPMTILLWEVTDKWLLAKPISGTGRSWSTTVVAPREKKLHNFKSKSVLNRTRRSKVSTTDAKQGAGVMPAGCPIYGGVWLAAKAHTPISIGTYLTWSINNRISNSLNLHKKGACVMYVFVVLEIVGRLFRTPFCGGSSKQWHTKRLRNLVHP